MARPSQSTPSLPDGAAIAQPKSILPTAAVQAERLVQAFPHLRIGAGTHGGIEHAEIQVPRPVESEGLIVFPRPSALDRRFRDAIRRLWHTCLAKYQIVGTKNQSADPPDPELFPESCEGFHEHGFGIAYGDVCVAPAQLGGAHRRSSPKGAYDGLGGERPLFAYESLAVLIGITEIAEQIRNGKAALRFVERVRDTLDPTVRILRQRRNRLVPEFAVLSGDGARILLSGEPSPNRVPGPNGGMGLATRFPIAAAKLGR